MPKTDADEWFEIYLLDHGYTPGEHEPDLTSFGIGSKPDFLPTNASGEQIVCEVKAFGPNRLTRRLQLGRFFSTLGDELWTPVRDQVRAAARTLKPVQLLGLLSWWSLQTPIRAYSLTCPSKPSRARCSDVVES